MKWIQYIFFVTILVGCSLGENISERDNPSQTVGLFKNEPGSFNGFTLFAPSTGNKTYLIDNQGGKVHEWKSKYIVSSVYLLENGHLLRTAIANPLSHSAAKSFGNHGSVKAIDEYDWNSNLLWHFTLPNDRYQMHHDVASLPNGNILIIAWERLLETEALAYGRDPSLLNPLENNELWAEAIFEIKPDYKSGTKGTVVWEWHLIDHLVQEKFPDKKNFHGNLGVKENPGLVDINYVSTGQAKVSKVADWIHLNSIAYNPKTDQIMLSSREFSELWIIDHNTTTEKSAGAAGNLLYRYGNPRTHHQGSRDDQTLFYQHNAQWIREGLPGAGNILVFNNGADRPDGSSYSSILEISPDYSQYSKGNIVWSYTSPNKFDFYSSIVSGAQRLPNGNSLIAEGMTGRIFEVTPEGETVWLYVNPAVRGGPIQQGEEIPMMKNFIENVSQNLLFKATRYAPDYAGLVGKDLSPKGTIEKY